MIRMILIAAFLAAGIGLIHLVYRLPRFSGAPSPQHLAFGGGGRGCRLCLPAHPPRTQRPSGHLLARAGTRDTGVRDLGLPRGPRRWPPHRAV
ncbi:hypothetical protein Rsph17029_1770 [Rhodobacter sphaeroides ATCC 17029]|nr:hypothetical protein Rsph17029_1770 [Cereibacter sphaeroides ATCC 17029]